MQILSMYAHILDSEEEEVRKRDVANNEKTRKTNGNVALNLEGYIGWSFK